MQRVIAGLAVLQMTCALGCSANTVSPSESMTSAKAGAGAAPGSVVAAAAGRGSSGAASTLPVSAPAVSAGTMAKSGSFAPPPTVPAGGGAGAAASAIGGAGSAAPAAVGGSPATAGAAAPGGDSSITGTLGALGPAKPVVNGWATTNGLETLIYLSSSPLTCAQMMTRGVKWLGMLPAGTQVIEIVVGQPSMVKSYTIGSSAALGGGEVNYAEGSKSSATEVTGKSGTITFTTATAKGVQEGTIDVSAPFMAKGHFHAEWCEGGTEY